ncbi:MAG: SEC-C metal-binding domain-containing protein [Lachnospiraceae bacterium]|nr:SEC-C domain-containing protein [Robinsoniella sp.]MDY3765295.1 SEC-C metal-binding domain-containing protein [Lachnospiraceae bacterium]
MKAYQIKIQLNQSHPPIWRRAVIPAGLSFSQLIVILNEIMGWNGSHLSSFRFSNQQVTIEEDVESNFADMMDFDDFELLEASETLIDSFLDSEKKFLYLYDFGDDWKHTVTVEKILPDYEQDYPAVLKFKENTPYEDCGGIWAYYDLLNLLKNPSDPEYESMKDWTESIGYRPYCLDDVNERLKHFRLSEKKGKPLMSYEIYEEVFEKHQPLKQIRPSSKKGQIVSPKSQENISFMNEHREDLEKLLRDMEAYMQTFNTQFSQQQLNLLPKDPKDLTVRDLLSQMTKSQLTSIAQAHSLKGYSRYKKSELLDFVSSEIMRDEILKQYFLYLEDSEIECFDRGLSSPQDVLLSWPGDEFYLQEGGYCIVMYGDECIIPAEVWEAYKRNCTESWKKERKEKKDFLDHLNAAVLLNGCCDIQTALSMYEHNTGIRKKESDVISVLNTVSEEKVQFFFDQNQMILDYLDDEEIIYELRETHKGKTFYMPTPEEVKSLACDGYLKFDHHMECLKQFFIQVMDNEPDFAEDTCIEIQEIIRMDGEFEEVLELIEDYNDDIKLNQKQVKQLLTLIQNVWNNTRRISLCGHTPDELYKKSSQTKDSSQTAAPKIIDFASCKQNKIYPNDPCPCGSGKKYKHCCGKGKK